MRERGEKTEDEKGAQGEEDLKVAGERWEEDREERGRERKGEVRKTGEMVERREENWKIGGEEN